MNDVSFNGCRGFPPQINRKWTIGARGTKAIQIDLSPALLKSASIGADTRKLDFYYV